MSDMRITAEATEKGVTEHSFTLDRPDEPVPGVLWLPEGASGPRPLVLLCHGGTQEKRAPNIVALGRRLVRHLGYAAVAIDCPHHGERMPEAERRMSREERRQAMRGRLFGEGRRATMERAMGDWTETLDAVSARPDVGVGPVGWWGLSMGCAFGVPFVSREPRVNAAVLGLAGWDESSPRAGFDELARNITVPVLFIVQWHDEVVRREHACNLFGLLGSERKTMHANPGRHVEVPLFERRAAEDFFAEHLGPVAAPAEAPAA
jgi:dienelactone hydrolase